MKTKKETSRPVPPRRMCTRSVTTHAVLTEEYPKTPLFRAPRVGRFLPGLLVGLAAGIAGCESKSDFRNLSQERSETHALSSDSAAASPAGGGKDCCTNQTKPLEPGSIVASLGLVPVKIPAALVTDQTGRRLDLARDLIGRRVAAIQFIFTRCATTCPILGHQFAEVRNKLDDRMPDDFALISVSVDPEYDTPERLRELEQAPRCRAGVVVRDRTEVRNGPAAEGARGICRRSPEPSSAGARRGRSDRAGTTNQRPRLSEPVG